MLLEERNISSENARKEIGVSDKTLNAYGDFLQPIFPDFAGGVKRRRKYNSRDMAMLREYKKIKDKPENEIIIEMIKIFCGNRATLKLNIFNDK